MVEDETSAECALEDDKNPEMQSAHAKIVDAIAKKSPEASLSVDQVFPYLTFDLFKWILQIITINN